MVSIQKNLHLILVVLLAVIHGCFIGNVAAQPGPSKQPPTRITATPQEQQQIEIWISQLKDWPKASAKRAAQAIIGQGAKSNPFILMALLQGDSATKVAAAYCAGQLKIPTAFHSIAELVHNPQFRSSLETLFIALVKIDPEKSYPVLIEVLKSQVQTGHTPAMKLLYGMTKTKHLPLLQELLQSKLDRTRKYAVELLARINTPEARNLIVESMHDPSPYVAGTALELLGQMDSKELRDQLQTYVNHHDRRFVSYVVLVLVQQEDKFQLQLLQDAWVPELLKSLRNSDYFIKGVAAVALSNVGFQSSDTEIIDIMDKNLVPVLIDVLSGKTYFRDYNVLKPIAYRKLKQLTGKDLGWDTNQWWSWWNAFSPQFRAIRLLKGVSEEEIRALTLEYLYQGGLEQKKCVFVGTPEALDAFPNDKVIILDWTQLMRLLDIFRETRLLEMQAEFGLPQPDFGHRISLKLHNQRKNITVYSNDPGPLSSVMEVIDQLTNDNNWQQYWDRAKPKDRISWYTNEQKWFSATSEPELRAARIKRLLLASYSNLKPQEREAAAHHLLQLMQIKNDLAPGQIQSALFNIRIEGEVNNRTELLIQALSLSKDSIALQGCIEFLIQHYSPRAQPLLELVFQQGDTDFLRQYLRHPNPYLRSGAADVLGQRPSEEIVVLNLIAMIKDEHIVPRQAAVLALGKLKAKNAWEPLLQLVQEASTLTVIRQSALQALADIDPNEATSIVLNMLSSQDIGMRLAAAKALAKIGGSTSVSGLAALLQGDVVKTVQETAADSLTRVNPQNEAIAALAQIVTKAPSSEAQLLAIQTLQRIPSPQVSKQLAVWLDHPLEDVRIEAALALAALEDRRAIPLLIIHLNHPRYTSSIRRALEKITLVSFPEVEAKERYTDWWRLNQELPNDQWFFEALRLRGYTMTAFLDYLMEGNKNPAMIPVLIQALNDTDWYIRMAANQKLIEFTGQSFGQIHAYTSIPDTRKIIQDWRDWYEKNHPLKKG